VTVLDTSVVIDFLLADGVADDVAALLRADDTPAAPDVIVFEVLAVLRRDVQRRTLSAARASAALDDLDDLQIELFPTRPLAGRAWALRNNLTAADALFIALAERLSEPLVTKDRGLATAAQSFTAIGVIQLGPSVP